MAQPNFQNEEESKIFCRDNIFQAHNQFLKEIWTAVVNYQNKIDSISVTRLMDIMRRVPNSVFSEVNQLVQNEIKKNSGDTVNFAKKNITEIDLKGTEHFKNLGYSAVEIFSDEEEEFEDEDDDFIDH